MGVEIQWWTRPEPATRRCICAPCNSIRHHRSPANTSLAAPCSPHECNARFALTAMNAMQACFGPYPSCPSVTPRLHHPPPPKSRAQTLHLEQPSAPRNCKHVVERQDAVTCGGLCHPIYAFPPEHIAACDTNAELKRKYKRSNSNANAASDCIPPEINDNLRASPRGFKPWGWPRAAAQALKKWSRAGRRG